MLQYSFRKSFLITNNALKADQQPIQHLLPPQIPHGSLVRTYSFSQLNHHNQNNITHINNNNNNNNNNNDDQQISISLQNNQDHIKVTQNNNTNSISMTFEYNDQQSLSLNQVNNVIRNKRKEYNHNNKSQIMIEQLLMQNQKIKQQLIQIKQSKLDLLEENKIIMDKYKQLKENYQINEKKYQETIKIQQDEINKYKQIVKQLQSVIIKKSSQISDYELRNQESRRLLQKLNENINKKQQKLLKDNQSLLSQIQQLKMKVINFPEIELGYQHEIERLTREVHEMRVKNQVLEGNYSIRRGNVIGDVVTDKDQDMGEYKQQGMKGQSQGNQINMKEIIKKLQKDCQHEIQRFQLIIQGKQNQINELRERLVDYEQMAKQKQKENKILKQLNSSQSQEIILRNQTESGKILQLTQKIIMMEEERQKQEGQHKRQVQKLNNQVSKNNKLTLQLENQVYELREVQQKVVFYEDQLGKLNQIVNELRQDKQLLIKDKQQLKQQLIEKINQNERIREQLQIKKQKQRKYLSMIQKYQNEQEKLHQQQAQYIESLSGYEVRIKTLVINQEQLKRENSQQRQVIGTLNYEVEKWKKKYCKQHKLLNVYKQETLTTKNNTESKWNELKQYYEQQIQSLETKLRSKQSAKKSVGMLDSSRKTVENVMNKQKQHVEIDTSITKRRRFEQNCEQVKQNYLRGLNHDDYSYQNERT